MRVTHLETLRCVRGRRNVRSPVATDYKRVFDPTERQMRLRQNSVWGIWGHLWGHSNKWTVQCRRGSRLEPFNTKDTVSARNNEKSLPCGRLFSLFRTEKVGFEDGAP